MSYIGRDIRTGAFRQLDDISSGFDGSDTTHTMQVNSTNVSVGDVNQILLSLGGVIQKPGTDFTVSGSTLTFTTAPAANTSFFAILLGSDNGGTVTPTDGSVTGDKLASTVTTSSNISLDGGTFIFNESGADKDFRIESSSNANALHVDGGNSSVGINTTGPSDATLEIHDSVSIIKLQDTDDNTFSRMYHSGGNFLIDVDKGDTGSGSYFQMGVDDEQVMKITADGEATFVKQPSFRVLSAEMSNVARNQYNTVQFNSELFDIGSNFNTSTYTFTAPVTGKYMLCAAILFQDVDGAGGDYLGVRLETSNHSVWSHLYTVSGLDADIAYYPVQIANVYDMDASDTAYVRLYLNDSATGSNVLDINSGATLFTGMLIG